MGNIVGVKLAHPNAAVNGRNIDTVRHRETIGEPIVIGRRCNIAFFQSSFYEPKNHPLLDSARWQVVVDAQTSGDAASCRKNLMSTTTPFDNSQTAALKQ